MWNFGKMNFGKMGLTKWISVKQVSVKWADTLNNFTYAPFACLVWPKCSNYVVKVKNKSRFSIIQKKS